MTLPTIIKASDFPTPETSARRPMLPGMELVLADGKTWILADYVPALADVWDRIYDQNQLCTYYDRYDVLLAAAHLLDANYDLPPDFRAWLILGADLNKLARAIEAAMFGMKDKLLSWSDWTMTALYANGLDPADIPVEQVQPVLNQLIATGRAVHHTQYTTSGKAAGYRRDLMVDFKRAGIKETPYQRPETEAKAGTPPTPGPAESPASGASQA